MTNALSALERLHRGNDRFLAKVRDGGEQSRPVLLPDGQRPFAVVLCCSDSRVPPELIFSQGFGDLFVIRVAGNIVTPAVLGSVEFAFEVLGTGLVVVLGHSGCGAVEATVGAVGRGRAGVPGNLGSIIESIRPAVESVLEEESGSAREGLLGRAVAANVRASARRLLDESMLLAKGANAGEVAVVSGVYSLETGVVEFLDSSRPGSTP